MKFRVYYSVHDICSVIIEADNEDHAREIVMSGDFEEDETYEFLDAEITGVSRVETL